MAKNKSLTMGEFGAILFVLGIIIGVFWDILYGIIIGTFGLILSEAERHDKKKRRGI